MKKVFLVLLMALLAASGLFAEGLSIFRMLTPSFSQS